VRRAETLRGHGESTVSGLHPAWNAYQDPNTPGILGRLVRMSDQTTPAGRPLIPGTASWLQRVGALLIDWAASSLVAAVILGGFTGQAYQWLPLGIFWVESAVGVALTGASFGQNLLKLRVRRTDGVPLSLGAALLRQALVCVVVPPLVFREDGRGLHDILTDAAVYPLKPHPQA